MSKKQIYSYSVYIAALSGLALLNSCVPQSKYSAPKFEIPENYRMQEDSLQINSDSTNIADINWESFFKDEELITLIQSGLEHNFDMQTALKNIEIADQKAKQAKLEWLPSINADIAGINRQFRSKNFYSSPTSNYYKDKEAPENMYTYNPQHYSGLALSWELDIWGKMRSKNVEALAQYLKTHEAKKAIQTEIIAQIAAGYYNLLLLDAQMEVAETNYELTKNTLRIVELQRDAGQITSLAIQQTKNQMLVAKALIPSLKQQISVQENTLSLLTGQLPQDIDRSTKLANIDYDKNLTAGVPLYMVSQRPDVRVAELELKAKNASVGIAQTNRYPALTIDLTGGVNSMLGKNWFNIPGSLFGGVIGKLAAPVFNKRKLKTDFEVAKLERNKAEIDLQKAVYTAITEVTNALINLNTVDEQIEIAEEQVSTSRLGVKQSNLLFNSGYATYIEVINAQKNMLDNELNLNRLKQNKLLSRVQLYKTLGGG